MLAAAKEAGHPAPKVVSYKMDVIDRDVIESTAKQADTDFSGRIDILINNAGYLEKFVPIAESDPDEWWKTWTINIRGVYLVIRAFLPIMLRGGDKQIVNLSSIGALRSRPGASAYQTGKFALLRFTEFIISEYESQGILAFSVHPGGIMTELAGNMPKELHGSKHNCFAHFSSFKATNEKCIVLSDKPEIAGDTICFLTAKRQEWLAGRYISCTWDMEEFFAKKNEIIERDLLKYKLLM